MIYNSFESVVKYLFISFFQSSSEMYIQFEIIRQKLMANIDQKYKFCKYNFNINVKLNKCNLFKMQFFIVCVC